MFLNPFISSNRQFLIMLFERFLLQVIACSGCYLPSPTSIL